MFGCLNVASIIYLGYSFMLFCVAVGVCVKVTSCYLSNFYSFRITDPTSETGDNQLLPDS